MYDRLTIRSVMRLANYYRGNIKVLKVQLEENNFSKCI